MFCSILASLQISFANIEVSRGSLSEIILVGIPYDGKTLSKYNLASSSVVIDSLHGKRRTAFEQS